MKIIAEFNSNEELLSFINTFGAKSIVKTQPVVQAQVDTKKIVEAAKEVVQVAEVKESEETITKDDTEITEVVQHHSPDKEGVKKEETETAPKEEKKDEKPKITKEMVRERIAAIMKSGKQKEAKELIAKYGASKLPDLKEENYDAVYNEAETLL